ncbi:UDP-N-acetylmuramate dehydrogenase [Agrococcus sp. HG114]|uniref:UDP-N-acetylmuramate dehydrogenase n=1 Tax=Agrococcus sp. HG114 TaxID=2969757 RepID=UPI00215A34B5|nr:UDP-N-acetylmuramate dehydrogenase [Agrococcus sp. HG114]MCR8670393.1 UDP-N-acetylmuramate dehydrogenase [Agrococcus sp. HG114]
MTRAVAESDEHGAAVRALADATTMRVGGEVRRWIDATTREEVAAAYAEALADDHEPLLLLGGGSNTVASSEPFDGTVLRVATRGIRTLPAPPPPHRPEGEQPPADDSVVLRVEAGEPWDALVERAVGEGLAGIEALSGVPGSTGAAPIQNIGAYGQELSSTLVGLELLDAETLEVRSVPAAELRLGYRDSAIKQGVLRGVVLSVDLRLRRSADGRSQPIAYQQLASALGVELGTRVPLEDVRASVLALRSSKGMVLSDDPDSVSAGSFFTNPIVSARFAAGLPADAPRWSVAPGPAGPAPRPTVLPLEAADLSAVPPLERPVPRVKLSAAWLIEHSGIGRGFALPGSRAAISSKHTLALTNRGGATGEEIAELARFVQARVENQFGVHLVPEPVLVGLQL